MKTAFLLMGFLRTNSYICIWEVMDRYDIYFEPNCTLDFCPSAFITFGSLILDWSLLQCGSYDSSVILNWIVPLDMKKGIALVCSQISTKVTQTWKVYKLCELNAFHCTECGLGCTIYTFTLENVMDPRFNPNLSWFCMQPVFS